MSLGLTGVFYVVAAATALSIGLIVGYCVALGGLHYVWGGRGRRDT